MNGLSFCLCSLEVTVNSLHPPRLCRIAVFSIKPTFSLKQNPSFSPALSSESSPHEYLPSLTLGVPHSNYKLQTISQPPSLRQRSLAVFAMFVSLRGISVQTTVVSLVNVPPALYFASSQTTRANRELTSTKTAASVRTVHWTSPSP